MNKINSNKLFYELSPSSLIAEQVLAEAIRPNANWGTDYDFTSLHIGNDVFNLDPMLAEIGKRHPFKGGVLMLPPNTCYNWHKDSERGVSINMLLNPHSGLSHCLFHTDAQKVVGTVYELKYKPNTWYLFNTQVDHMVINFEAPRYLLTVTFLENKHHLSYEKLLSELL